MGEIVSMKCHFCVDCGVIRHAGHECAARDVLQILEATRAHLAEMTRACQEDHTALMLVSGALCDAATVPVEPYHEAVRLLTKQRDTERARAEAAEKERDEARAALQDERDFNRDGVRSFAKACRTYAGEEECSEDDVLNAIRAACNAGCDLGVDATEVDDAVRRLLAKEKALREALRDCGTHEINADTCGVCGKHFADCETDTRYAGHMSDPETPVPPPVEYACPGARARAALATPAASDAGDGKEAK